jgi:hypothetical protein
LDSKQTRPIKQTTTKSLASIGAFSTVLRLPLVHVGSSYRRHDAPPTTQDNAKAFAEEFWDKEDGQL